MDVITTLLTSLFNKMVQFVQDVFNAIFSNWNYGILFSWLPQDIQQAVTYIILFLFAIAVFYLIKNLNPF